MAQSVVSLSMTATHQDCQNLCAMRSCRVMLLVAVLAGGVSLSALGAAEAPASGPAPMARFSHLPRGWHQYRDTPVMRDVLALSWRYRPNSAGWAPSMPRGGIAVDVHFLPGKPHYDRLRLVLPRRPTTLLEGTRDTPEYRIYGRVRGSDLIISVDIRRLHPTQAQLSTARRIVSLIRFS